MTIIREIDADESLAPLCELARRTWLEHYLPIIGAPQIEFMLEKFQSETAVKHQITEEKYRYFAAFDEEKPRGYIAMKAEDNGSLFLSKLYVEKQSRRKGIAGNLIRAAIESFHPLHGTPVKLTVNRHNSDTIMAYEKLGFFKTGEKLADIGGGFFMDDYLMEAVTPLFSNSK